MVRGFERDQNVRVDWRMTGLPGIGCDLYNLHRSCEPGHTYKPTRFDESLRVPQAGVCEQNDINGWKKGHRLVSLTPIG